MSNYIFSIVLFSMFVIGPNAAQTNGFNQIKKVSFNKHHFQGQTMKLSEMEDIFNLFPETSEIYQRNRAYNKTFKNNGIVCLYSTAIAVSSGLLLSRIDEDVVPRALIFFPALILGVITWNITIVSGTLHLTTRYKLINNFNNLNRQQNHESPVIGFGATEHGIGLTLSF